MNLLFDSWSTQVLVQQAPPSYPPPDPSAPAPPTPTGMRLNTLLGAIRSAGLSCETPWNVAFTTPPITSEQLEGVDVYISLTRFQGGGFAYEAAELTAIEQWVSGGGNVLLMSNHGGFPGHVDDNYTANDAPLAALFAVALQDYSVQNWNNPPDPSNIMTVEATIPYLANQVPSMTTHNSCIIVPSNPENCTPIVYFPASWSAFSPKSGQYSSPATPYFALLAPYSSAAGGSMLVMGNSGWVADYGSPFPACGLVPYESNLMFVLNCIGYLGGLRSIPPAGKCPCWSV
ncbi:MAG TPA: hypothetical protein VF006_15520 [Longimicrobium sp.]